MNDLLAKQSVIEGYLAKGRYSLSAFSFVNIFAWLDFFRFECRDIDGCLCVFAHQDVGCFQYLPPLGDAVTPEVITQCFEYMCDVNKGSSLSRIENVPEEMLDIFDRRLYSSSARAKEFCYWRKDIAEMKGVAFASQRWMWNHFRKHYAYAFEPYQTSDAPACAELYDRWAADRMSRHSDDIYCEMIRENKMVHRRVLEAFEQLDLIGRVIKVDGVIVGYTFGYPVSERVFCNLFEITDLSFKGLSSVIFREFCLDADVQSYEIMNVMDDFGMPNVKKTKMHFNPRLLLPSYAVSLR